MTLVRVRVRVRVRVDPATGGTGLLQHGEHAVTVGQPLDRPRRGDQGRASRTYSEFNPAEGEVTSRDSGSCRVLAVLAQAKRHCDNAR